MLFQPALAITRRQIFLLQGSATRFVQMFIWVIVDVFLWGFMTRYLNKFTGHVDLLLSLLGAVLFWDFMVRVMQGVTLAFFEDVYSRNFLNLFASPLTIRSYLSGLVLSSILTSTLCMVVIMTLAKLSFGLSISAYGMAILPFLAVLFLFGIALGIFGCGIVLRLGPSAEWFVWPIPAILSPFVGVFYPLSTLPPAMQTIASVLPPSYVFEGIRSIAVGQAVDYSLLGMAAGLTLIYIAAGIGFFVYIFRYSLRTGILARYSAESLS